MSFHVRTPRGDRLRKFVFFCSSVVITFFGGDPSEQACSGKNSMIDFSASGCKPNFLDSTKGSDLPGGHLFRRRVHIDSHMFLFPNIMMSSTYLEKNTCDLRWTRRPSQVGTLFLFVVRVSTSTSFLSHSNPAPTGDRVGFAQGDRLVLQSNPTVSVFDWVVVVSILVDTHSLAIVVIWRRLTDAPACRLILHRCPLQPCQGVMHFVCRDFAAATHEADALLLSECCFVSTVVFDYVLLEEDSPSVFLEMSRKHGVFQVAEVHEGCADLGLTFLTSQAGRFFNLSHSLSAAALASGMFIAAFYSDGLVHHRHVSFFGDVVHVLLWFLPRSLRSC